MILEGRVITIERTRKAMRMMHRMPSWEGSKQTLYLEYWNLPQCFYFVIITSQVQKRVHSGKRPGSFGLVEEQEGAVSDAGETGQEVPVCSGHKHPGRACVQLDGFPVEQEEAQPVWWKRHHAALPEGQPGALNVELWVDVCLIPRWDDNKLWYPHIASKLICFPGDIFVLIGFVIIGG